MTTADTHHPGQHCRTAADGRARVRRAALVGVGLLVTALVSGCGLWSDSSGEEPSGQGADSPSPTARITEPNDVVEEQAELFEWQQQQAQHRPEVQAVVETAKYHIFREHLTNREPRYVDPAAEDLFADISWETIEDPSGMVAEGNRLRGPSSARLMGIKISGDRAYTVGCTDRHRSEFTGGDSTGWGPVPNEYKVFGLDLIRSEESPTGWVHEFGTYTGDDELPLPDCSAQVFKTPAAVSEQGPVDVPQ